MNRPVCAFELAFDYHRWMISHRAMEGRPLDEVDRRLAPVSMADERLLAVPEALAELFPGGGLRQGWSVGVDGDGGWSVGLAMVGAAIGADGWVACVGLESLGLVAADELGLRLDRLIMVETPEPSQWATVMAALVEAVDVICIGPAASVGGRRHLRDARRLSARAREQGCVLFHFDGGRAWPQGLDVVLEARSRGWSGIGEGYGHLRSRRLAVEACGRRSMAKPRTVEVLCPGEGGGLTSAPGAVERPVDGVVEGAGARMGRGGWPVSA